MHFKILLYWGTGSAPPQTPPHHFSFQKINIKFYHANQCVPRRRKNKHWSEGATFEKYWYALSLMHR